GEYYVTHKKDNGNYRLIHKPRKSKKKNSPANIPDITYDRLVKNFIVVDSGVSDKTIKSYLSFFEKLNNKKSEFPKIRFEKKCVFIARKSLWNELSEKSKIPSTYIPNPRDLDDISETRSIPAISDCIVYFTPKYEVCYQNILLEQEDIKTVVVFDTEMDKIEQILQDKARFGFNLIILSNSLKPVKNQKIPCWNWFKEEMEIVNAI